MLLSNACRCVKSFGIAEPDLELICVPTHSELVRGWEHTPVVLRHQKRNKGEAFWGLVWKDSSAVCLHTSQGTWAPPSSGPYLHEFSLTLGCVREEGAQPFLQSHLTSSRASAGTLSHPSHLARIRPCCQPSTDFPGRAWCDRFAINGSLAQPTHWPLSRYVTQPFSISEGFLQGAEASSLYLSEGLY